MKKITQLTEAQKARLDSWCKEWIEIGLSTERADWDRFEKAIRACYRYANLPDNVPIIRVKSPWVVAFAAPLAANIIASVRGNNYSAVDSSVGSSVYSSVYSAVGSSVGSSVSSAVSSSVDSAVDSAVVSAVGSA